MDQDTPNKHKQVAERSQMEIPIDQIVPDPDNRTIDETDDGFIALMDSVRLFGVLQRIHVRVEGGTYQLIDGERRWRAAKQVGLPAVPSEVWPAAATRADILAAGIVLNDHREAHSCIHIARRLRDVKNSDGLSIEQLAQRLALSLNRVKTYFSLFSASDFLLQFLAAHDIPLWVAAEFVRYEKATNEARSRHLAERYLETPLTRDQIIRLRTRESEKHSRAEGDGPVVRRPSFVQAIERAYRRNPESTIAELEAAAVGLGFRLIAVEATKTEKVR